MRASETGGDQSLERRQALADAQSLVDGPAIQVRCLECGGLTPSGNRLLAKTSFLDLLKAKIGL